MSETKTYRGNCHCGAFVFELEAPEIKTASECNCSLCSKRGYLWLLPQKAPTIVKDEGRLVHYTFASKRVDHQFCGNCGTTVLAKSDEFPAGFGINVRTIQDLDIWSLEVKLFNGAEFDPQYAVPAYSGPEPNPSGLENGKTYYGSCHCGAVTTAVRLDAALEDGSYKGIILECNCSVCQRCGYILTYPKQHQVAIQGRENLAAYVFGHRVWRVLFCKTCGVHVIRDANAMTDDELAALPEEVRNFAKSKAGIRPINLRALNGFDVKSVKPMRWDGWNSLQPPYVNP